MVSIEKTESGVTHKIMITVKVANQLSVTSRKICQTLLSLY